MASYFTSTFVIDELGRVKETSVPQGSPDFPLDAAITRYDFNPGGTVARTHFPRENAGEDIVPMVYQYDEAGRQTGMTDTIGALTTYTFDAVGNIETITEAGNATTATRATTLNYDQLNRVIRVLDAEGYQTLTTYDSVGNAIKTEGPFANEDGRATLVRTFDGRSLLRSETNAENNTATYGYDLSGNRTLIGDPRGSWANSFYEYDGAGRLIQVDRPSGTEAEPGPMLTYKMSYDGVGNVIMSADPRGDAFATLTTYDHRGKPLTVKTAAGDSDSPVLETDSYTYDIVGNLIRQVDPRGESYATTYQVDAAGRPLSTTYAVLSEHGTQTLTETHRYDVEGNLVEHVGIGGPLYVTTYYYDGLGRLIRSVDPVGESVELTRDRFGNVLTTTDVYGTSINTYDGLNRLLTASNGERETTQYDYLDGGLRVQMTDPLDRTSFTLRDRLGRVTKTIDAVGNESTTKYDAAGNVVEMVDRNGHISRSEYDVRGMALSVTRGFGTADAITLGYEYDELGRKTVEIDPRGEYYRTEHTYDARGRLVQTRRRAGTPDDAGVGSPGQTDWIVEKYEYDGAGNVVSKTPARGDFYKIINTIDGLGRITSMSHQTGTPDDPRRVREEFIHNNAGQIIQSVDALGHEISRVYDRVGRITNETIVRDGADDLVNAWRYIDSEAGYRIEQTDAAGQTSLATDYDEARRVVKIDPRVGETQTIEYDDAGNTIVTTVGAITRRYDYNALDRVESESDDSGNSVTYTYFPAGNIRTKQDASAEGPYTYTYNSLDQQIGISEPDGGLTLLSYDDAGNLSKVIDGNGNTTTFVFDAMHRVVSETNEFGTRTFEYDPDGNVLRYTDRNDRSVTRTYDGNNRMLTEAWLGVDDSNAGGLAFTYDAIGRMTSADGGSGTVNTFTFANDASSRIDSTQTTLFAGAPTFTSRLTYNAISQVEAFAVDYGSKLGVVAEAFTYDEDNDRLRAIRQTGSSVATKSVEFDYHDNVPVYSQVRRYSDDALILMTTTTLNDRKLVEQIEHLAGSTPINRYSYTFDGDDRIKTASDRYGTSTYAYDDAGRLLSVDHTDPHKPDESYVLDDAGNRTESSIHGGAYSYLPQNRVSGDGVFNYQYDNEGNLISQTRIVDGDVTTFAWDHRNRLIAATTVNTAGELIKVVELGYDALDRRVWKRVDSDGAASKPSIWRGYLYNDQDVLLEIVDVDGVGSGSDPVIDVVYLHGAAGDTPLAQDRGGDVLWLLPDMAGTVGDVVNVDQELVDHIRYTAYGTILSRTDEEVIQSILLCGSRL